MAKRPPSNPVDEAALVKAAVVPEETAAPEPVTVTGTDPVGPTEPARPEALGPGEEVFGSETTQPVDPQPDESASLEPQPEGPTPVAAASVAPEPERPDPQPTPVQQEKSGGGFLATALGGVVAAAAGYALALFVPLPGMAPPDAPPAATQADVQALAGRIDALESAPAPAPDAALEDRLAALEAQPVSEAPAQPDLAPLTDALSDLESRLATLESRPTSASGDAAPADVVALVESLRAEIAELRSSRDEVAANVEALAAQTEERLAQAEAQAEALRAESEATAGRAVTAAALNRVQAALESGVPFSGALADLAGTEIPPALSDLSETGVPTLGALEDGFPPAARAALDASRRANMGEGWSDRLGSLFQATTGARSLTPREGSDPDAVLSRAEAAVGTGDLAQALAELQALPPEGLAEMAEWSALAQQRLDALEAAAALSAAAQE